MSDSRVCPGCAMNFMARPGAARMVVLCPWCGAECPPANAPPPPPPPLPEPVAATPPPAPPPQKARRSRPVSAPAAPPPAPAKQAAPTTTAGTFDDDLNPYPMPAEKPIRRCVRCQTALDEGSEVCPRCDVEQETGHKIERVYARVERTWEAGWPYERRVKAFIALQVLNIVTIIVLWIFLKHFPFSLLGIAFYVALQALLIGSFDRIAVARNRKGQVLLTRTWRIGFFEVKPQTIHWKEYEDLLLGRYHELSIFDWWMLLVLFASGIVPAILWWYYVIHPERTYLAMCRDHGYPDEYLYRGLSEEQARDLADTISELTGLRVRGKL